MIFTLQDIQRLLDLATNEERDELARLLDVDNENVWSAATASTLVKQLLWRYQTPLGYLTRTPTFDEMCVDVARRLKCAKLAAQPISCWTLLERLLAKLWNDMIKKMPESEREAFFKKLTEDESFGSLGIQGVDWAKTGGGGALLAIEQFGGFATYKVALIVTNQVAKAMVGRGLSLAANAVLVRGISVALGPVGWLLLIWGINDLMGTNYKRLIPAVLFIFCIYARLKQEGVLPWH